MKYAILILIGLAILARPSPTSAQPKRIYLAPDDHTDYMWKGDEATYRQAFLDMLDFYLDQADATASNPPEQQGRWNCDGSFWVQTYEQNRTPARFDRLISRIRDGHISMPLTALVSCYGGQPTEAVLRGMFYAGQIERRYNLDIPMAVAMENQTLPYGLGALWAGAGAKYSWHGICGCSTRVADPAHRDYEIYWWVGPDGSRILMKWNSMLNGNTAIGGYAEARDPLATVDFVDSDPGFLALYPYRIIGAFGKGWDDLKTLTDEFITAAQSKSNANRQVIVSNEQDFFDDFSATYGASLPEQSCSFGNEWDLYCASMAEVSASVKRSVEMLRGAEALATLVSLKNTSFMNGRTAARDQAWTDLGLYWEHNWTGDGVVSRDQRASWQRRLADEIKSYVTTLQIDAATALGAMIKKSGANQHFYAFNPLNWSRTDLADLPYADVSPIHVIDQATGQETPSQIVTVDGQRCLRILAQDVPGVGYKVFEIQPGAGATFTDAATVSGSIIENEFYRVTVAGRGAITSLIDKTRAGREFAQTVMGRAINDLGPGAGTLAIENAGPVSVTLVASSPDPLQHTTRITLLRGSRRIDLRNDIEQNFLTIQTWGFGFALTAPDVWHEEVGAVLRAKLLGDGGHYSPAHARYDWLTLNHFADMSGQGVGVTLANADCYFMQLGASTPNTLDTATPLLSPLVGGQVDGANLGEPNQNGDTHFMQRFALQTHDSFNAAQAMRFALEHQNPLLAAPVTGGIDYPPDSFALLNLSDPNLFLWSLKPAEDGIERGVVVRLWNLADRASDFTLALTGGMSLNGADRITHVETPQAAAELSHGVMHAILRPWQLQSFSLTLLGEPVRLSTFHEYSLLF